MVVDVLSSERFSLVHNHTFLLAVVGLVLVHVEVGKGGVVRSRVGVLLANVSLGDNVLLGNSLVVLGVYNRLNMVLQKVESRKTT